MLVHHHYADSTLPETGHCLLCLPAVLHIADIVFYHRTSITPLHPARICQVVRKSIVRPYNPALRMRNAIARQYLRHRDTDTVGHSKTGIDHQPTVLLQLLQPGDGGFSTGHAIEIIGLHALLHKIGLGINHHDCSFRPQPFGHFPEDGGIIVYQVGRICVSTAYSHNLDRTAYGFSLQEYLRLADIVFMVYIYYLRKGAGLQPDSFRYQCPLEIPHTRHSTTNALLEHVQGIRLQTIDTTGNVFVLRFLRIVKSLDSAASVRSHI